MRLYIIFFDFAVFLYGIGVQNMAAVSKILFAENCVGWIL